MESVYEKIDHSNLFPFKCFVTSLESSCYHWHEDYEVIFLLKGRFSVRINGERFNMKAGDLLLVNSEEVHSISQCQEGNIALFIQFHPDVLLKVMRVKNRKYYFYLNSCKQGVEFKNDYRHFKEAIAKIGILIFDKKPGYQFKACSSFYHFIGDLFSDAIYDVYYVDESSDSNQDTIILDKLIGYVKDKYREDLQSEDICSYLGVSRSTLYRYLKNKLGIPLTSFINYYRIEEAKKLLRNTDYTITYISEKCGFSNPQTFYRAFKKETGLTPNQFRGKEGEETNNSDQRIQGYVSFNNHEAYGLMKLYINSDRCS